MTRIHVAFIIIILVEVFFLFLGCQGGGGNPALPSISPDQEQMQADDPALGMAGPGENNIANTPALWGLYRMEYDSHSHVIRTIPVRGPAFAFNVVHFLQPPMSTPDKVAVTVLDDSEFMDTGRIDIRVILHHPFPGQTVYNGFDVCGIFITEGSIASPYDPDLTYASPEQDPTLLNPDGYTRWMNPTEFLTGNVFGYEPGFWGTSESSENSGFVAGATLNAYKYFAHGLGPDEDLMTWLSVPGNIDNRGMFPAGASCARDYSLNFPIIDNQLVFIFNYAVLANWTAPDVIPPSDPLTDFPISANAEYPLHIFVTDNSQVFYTEEDSGGDIKLEIEVFDWDAPYNPKGAAGEVTKFTLWADKPLIPGGVVEFMSTEVEWNSGFTANASMGEIEIDGAVPGEAGPTNLWIAVESAYPSSYDQGFDAQIPDDPVASYMVVPVDVKDCPKAFMSDISTDAGGLNSLVENVIMSGSKFVEGDELGVWMELEEAGDSAGDNTPFQIIGENVEYIDSQTISASFDLTNAPYGEYGLGCVNGCGIVTYPSENYNVIGGQTFFRVTYPKPPNMEILTGRDTYAPQAVTYIHVAWDAVQDADGYTVYVAVDDIYGYPVFEGEIASVTQTEYDLHLASLTFYGGGLLDVWVTATGTENSEAYESLPSSHAYLYYQNFEYAFGNWQAPAEDSATLRIVRSTVDASYDGMWGAKVLGEFPWYPALWAALVSPPIPEIEDATTVKFEFVHRHRGILPSNGYQVGWCETPPSDGYPVVDGYFPITSAAYGMDYNDTSSTALQSEFGVTDSTDNNFSNNYPTWFGWYLSGFDASTIIGNDKNDYLVVGLAGDYFDLLDFCIDEVAILIY